MNSILWEYITAKQLNWKMADDPISLLLGANNNNIDRNRFFSLKKDNRTRGHEVTLVKDQCRLDIRKYSFPQRTLAM